MGLIKVVVRTLATSFVACWACTGPPGPPVAAVSVTRADFGDADCGGSSGQSFELRNDGDSDLHWSVAGDGAFAPTSSSGTVAPHGVSSVVIAAAIPETAMPGQSFSGSVRIATDDPSQPEFVLPVSAVARGAVLDIPTTLDVGVTPVGFTTPPASLKVRNTGNVAVEITFGKPSAPSFAIETETFTIEPNKTSETVVRYTASAPESAKATTALTVRGPVCGVRPSSLALKALGTGGVLGFSPGVIDHGLVDCGTTTATQQVQFVNNGNVNVSISVTRKSDAMVVAKDQVIAPFGGTFAVGSFVTIPQTSAVTPGLYDDEYVVTADEKTYSIPIKATARGVILSFGSSPAFGAAAVDVLATQSVSVTNSGNVATTVSGASIGNVFRIASTFVPVGTTVVPFDVMPDPDKLGVVDTRSIPVAITAPRCGVDTPSASVRAFDRAVDATAGYDSRCFVGSNKRVYCSGDPGVGGIGYAGNSVTPRLTTVTADGVRLGGSMLCAYLDNNQFRSVSCWFGKVGQNAQYTVSKSEPLGTELLVGVPGDQGVNGHVCAIRPNGTLECLGANVSGAWGTGSFGPTFTPAWTSGMGSVAVSSYAGYIGPLSGAGAYGYVVVNGTIRSAGTNVGYSLGDFSDIGNGDVATPRVVDQINDAVSVSGWQGGGCVVHVGGAVTCWGGSNPSHFPIAPPLADIVTFGGGPSGCALRTGGLVSCVDPNTQTFVPVVTIGTPVRVLRADVRYNAVIVESDGRVSAGSFLGFSRVPGFD